MIILLYGPDTYRSRQKLQEIIVHYKKTRTTGLNLRYYNCEENNFEKLLPELQQTPMFNEKKLVVLKNAFQNPDFKEKLLKDSEHFDKTDNIFLFFDEGKILEKDRLFKFLKQKGRVQKFEFLEGAALRKWIKAEFEKFGSKPDSEAIEKLVSFVGSDSWRLSSEVKKLASFRRNKLITVKDVELLVAPEIETDIFKTIDAIAERNKKKALALLKKHLQKGDPPLYLLSMINYQFRNLLLVKSGGALKLKLHPYVVRKAVEQARRFSPEELKKIYRKIFETDLNIKTGKIEPETALDLLIAEI